MRLRARSCPCGAIHLQLPPYRFPTNPLRGNSPSAPTLQVPYESSLIWVGEALGPPARIRTGNVGSAKAGAVVEPQQRQFLHTQGPVARLEFRPFTQILRAGNIAKPDRYASPVMGSGESGPMGTKCPSAASPVAFCLLCRHGQSRSPPTGGEIPSGNETALTLPPHPPPSGAPSPGGEGWNKEGRRNPQRRRTTILMR